MRLLCIVGLLLLSTGLAAAQSPPQPDPFAGNLFAPEVLMQHQQAIGLGEDQRTFVKLEVRKTQARLTELQWDLQDEVEKLAALVKQDQADEALALAQLDKVLGLEREIKRTHIGLLIRIKNALRPEQLARLRALSGKAAED